MNFPVQSFWYGTVCVLALGVLPASAHAQPVEGTKILTWQFRAANIAKVRGSYSLVAKAYSGGTHGAGKGWKAAPPQRGMWLVDAPAGLPLKVAEKENDAEGHAVGMGRASVTALRAVKLPGNEKPPTYEVMTTTTAGGEDSIDPPHVRPGEWGLAKHKAKAVVKIANAKVKGWVLKGEINGVGVGTRSGKGTPNGRIDEGGHSIHDPVFVTIRELRTGRVWSEELLSLDILSQNGAGNAVYWEYNADVGVMLAAERDGDGGLDGSVSIGGASTSDWLVDSFGEFGATLDDGVFEATGSWADLPWVLSMEGFDVVRAELPPEFIPTTFDYVVPSDLLTDDFIYSQSLTWDDQSFGVVRDGAVPATGSLAILVASGLVGALRRRA